MSLLDEASLAAAAMVDDEALAKEELAERLALLDAQRERRVRRRLGLADADVVSVERFGSTEYVLTGGMVFLESFSSSGPAAHRRPLGPGHVAELVLTSLHVVGVDPSLARRPLSSPRHSRVGVSALRHYPLRVRSDLALVVADHREVVFAQDAVLAYLADNPSR